MSHYPELIAAIEDLKDAGAAMVQTLQEKVDESTGIGGGEVDHLMEQINDWEAAWAALNPIPQKAQTTDAVMLGGELLESPHQESQEQPSGATTMKATQDGCRVEEAVSAAPPDRGVAGHNDRVEGRDACGASLSHDGLGTEG